MPSPVNAITLPNNDRPPVLGELQKAALLLQDQIVLARAILDAEKIPDNAENILAAAKIIAINYKKSL